MSATITVATLSKGKQVVVPLSSELTCKSTVGELRDAIEAATGFAATDQILFCARTELPDDSTLLSECGVIEGAHASFSVIISSTAQSLARRSQ
jgi:hypothetical protein